MHSWTFLWLRSGAVYIRARNKITNWMMIGMYDVMCFYMAVCAGYLCEYCCRCACHRCVWKSEGSLGCWRLTSTLGQGSLVYHWLQKVSGLESFKGSSSVFPVSKEKPLVSTHILLFVGFEEYAYTVTASPTEPPTKLGFWVLKVIQILKGTDFIMYLPRLL